jgi:uncharacterized protein (UPF0332 family)
LKEETERALSSAHKHLLRAEKTLQIHLADIAAREAYSAALMAAMAIVFEFSGKGPKTHSGTKAVLHELVRDGVPIDRELLAIFDEGFELKAEADYGDPDRIATSDATSAIAAAKKFVAQAQTILESRP